MEEVEAELGVVLAEYDPLEVLLVLVVQLAQLRQHGPGAGSCADDDGRETLRSYVLDKIETR